MWGKAGRVSRGGRWEGGDGWPVCGFGSGNAGTLSRVSEQRKAWVTYSVLRLLFFVVPFAVLYVLALSLDMSMMVAGVTAAVLAALIGVALSILLLSKPREQASVSIHEWRNRERTADDIVEDEALDFGADSQEPAGGHSGEHSGEAR